LQRIRHGLASSWLWDWPASGQSVRRDRTHIGSCQLPVRLATGRTPCCVDELRLSLSMCPVRGTSRTPSGGSLRRGVRGLRRRMPCSGAAGALPRRGSTTSGRRSQVAMRCLGHAGRAAPRSSFNTGIERHRGAPPVRSASVISRSSKSRDPADGSATSDEARWGREHQLNKRRDIHPA
jgi:hypothetical protein